MKLQSKLAGAGVAAFVLLTSPAVQASPGQNAASVVNVTNSAVQSAVRSARDDAAHRALAHQQGTSAAKAR
jgi:hypothetical protein